MVREVKSNWQDSHPDDQSYRDFDEYDDLLKVLSPHRDEKKKKQNFDSNSIQKENLNS